MSMSNSNDNSTDLRFIEDGLVALPPRDDWTDEEISQAANPDNPTSVAKVATTRHGDEWRLAGDHRIDNHSGPLYIENPITDEREQIHPVHWEAGNWVRDSSGDLWLSESGYLVVLEKYTHGAGTRGYGLVYCGPYYVQSDYPQREVIPVTDAYDGE